jgi:hypothetical protein
MTRLGKSTKRASSMARAMMVDIPLVCSGNAVAVSFKAVEAESWPAQHATGARQAEERSRCRRAEGGEGPDRHC